jgi:hypothetical protein
MLSDACFDFRADLEDRDVTPRRIGQRAAKLAEQVDRWYNDGWYGFEPDAVIRAANAVAANPRDRSAVRRLKRLAKAVHKFHDYAYHDANKNKLYEELVSAVDAILPIPAVDYVMYRFTIAEAFDDIGIKGQARLIYNGEILIEVENDVQLKAGQKFRLTFANGDADVYKLESQYGMFAKQQREKDQ